MKLRSWLVRVRAGRNGMDELNRALWILAIALLILSLFIGPLRILGLAALIWEIFRCFSKNVSKRKEENAAFLRLKGKAKAEFGGAKNRFRQRKEYRFFRCPSCRAWLRVPRGKGKLHITCRQCGERFTKNT